MFSFSIAMDKNKGIGYQNVMPWHIKEELQLFRRNTLHHNIIMGKVTYENLPGKLKNRNIFVVTKDPNYTSEDVTVINDFQQFLLDNKDSEEEYIICGGASIYKQAYKYCTKGYVSIINNEYVVDRKFDEFDLSDFHVDESELYDQFTFYRLSR